MRCSCATGILILGLAGAAPLAAQRPIVPVAVQFSLFFRILTYDRTLVERGRDGVVIAVAFQGQVRASVLAADEAQLQTPPAAFPYAVRYVAMDLDTIADLAAALQRSGSDILYVAPLRAYRIASLVEAARARRVLTLTGSPDLVDQGLVVAIGLRGDRPEIVVNLAESRAGGADFSAAFLQVARVR